MKQYNVRRTIILLMLNGILIDEIADKVIMNRKLPKEEFINRVYKFIYEANEEPDVFHWK